MDIKKIASNRKLSHAVEMKLQISRIVSRLRIEKGWTQNKLATKSGLKQSAISRIEACDIMPTIPTLMKIAKALGKDICLKINQSNGYKL